MLRALRLLPLAALLLALGCGPGDQYVGGKPRTKVYRSVVSLSPSTTELLYSTMSVQQDKLKGKTAADNYPKVGYEKVPVVVTTKPDYEKIAEIRPDLIAYDASLYGPADVAKIKQLGADLYVVNANNLNDFITELYALGDMVGGETYMSDYVDRIENARAEGEAMKTHPTVAIIMPGEGSAHMIDGKNSFDADVVRAAGGDPVGPDATDFVPLDPELLVKLNPDYLVVSGHSPADLKPIQNDPRLASLKAIKSGNLIEVNPDILLRRGSRVDTLIDGIYHAIAK